ncbi:unnamed protein product, partial [Mesorhabditis belari]|uniref:Protein kinase domain-containing protein n=1 Tax=Mesorhabditis belari TaxID=2138241 RepID=A0AAF3FFJ0_9BILA
MNPSFIHLQQEINQEIGMIEKIYDVFVNCRYELESAENLYLEGMDERNEMIVHKNIAPIDVSIDFTNGKKEEDDDDAIDEGLFLEKKTWSSEHAQDVSYIIHTSGTTGIPKGSVNINESIINMSLQSTRHFFITSNDCTFQFTNFVYDNSVLEYSMAFVNGGLLIFEQQPFTPKNFVKNLKKHRITYALLFPGLVQMFSESELFELKRLRYWIVGAEKLAKSLFEKGLQIGVNIIQNYGPTETTCFAFYKHMKWGDHANNLGEIIQNAGFILRNRQENGKSKELLICGNGLMRGYLNRTIQESFVFHQRERFYDSGDLHSTIRERFYDSGDLVELLPDGRIVFLGRKDAQIKLNGHRVELGEIEASLVGINGVKHARCLLFNDQTLIAFYSGKEIEDLMSKLSSSIPRHMIPNEIFYLQEMPLTSNCKYAVKHLSYPNALLINVDGSIDGTLQTFEQHAQQMKEILEKWTSSPFQDQILLERMIRSSWEFLVMASEWTAPIATNSLKMSNSLNPVLSSACPTLGTSTYILVTITPAIDESSFIAILKFYTELTLNETTKYHFIFGSTPAAPVETDNLLKIIDQWIDKPDLLTSYYSQSLTKSKDDIQYGTEIADSVKYNIQGPVIAENTVSSSVAKKKQIVIICDYVNVNATFLLNDFIQTPNTLILGLSHDMNLDDIRHFAQFDVYSTIDDLKNIYNAFVKDVSFDFPTDQQSLIPAMNMIYVVDHLYMQSAEKVFLNMVSGALCHPLQGRMNDKFASITYVTANATREIDLPWLEAETADFGSKCISFFRKTSDISNSTNAQREVIEDFISSLYPSGATPANYTFSVLLLGKRLELSDQLEDQRLNVSAPFHIWADDDPLTVYNEVTSKILDKLSSDLDHLVLPYTWLSTQIYNESTVCRDVVSQTKLLASKPYHKTKHFYLAVDDMIWMTICAGSSAIIVGYMIYQKSRRLYQEQLEMMNEIAAQPLQYKVAKENVKMARLPWEIKADRVHIDRECVLGEGTHSDVYLGRLKGKAPIMQWIDRVEMRQFQDCAVAVRVPRRFDEAEEEQLFREVASMRRLRCHAHVALFLGWSSIDNLVCSLLELTHTNFGKYLRQINERMHEYAHEHDRIPHKQLYQIIWQICDGMAYIHQRHLIHRDLAARNILLTTELRAKISGFNFCSDPGDPKFGRGSGLIRRLPARWMAPEAYLGHFTAKSDVWSFGVLLWEVFSLGNAPFVDLPNDEAVHMAVAAGKMPAQPALASNHVYNRMRSCWRKEPGDRPNFEELKESSFDRYEKSHDNPTFTFEEHH